MKSFHPLPLLSIALVLFVFGPFTQAEAKSPYPVLDSGVWSGTSGATTYIYWIDNHRILFRTVKNNDKRLAYKGPFNLSVWEIGKEVRPYTPYVHRVTACLRDGVFRYTLEDEQKNIQLFHGKFGEEKLIAHPPKMTYYDFMNCRIEDNPEIAEKHRNDRAIDKLLDRHGYLDLGPVRGKASFENNQVTYFRVGQADGVVVSIRRYDVSGVQYLEFKDAYYMENLGAYARTGKPATTWWLYPDGKVEEVKIPVGPWATGISTQAYPTRQGSFMVSHAHKSGRDPGLAGGYLVRGEKFIKVIDGSVHGVAVSPDGCKVAFSHVRYFNADMATGNDPARRTLKVINFCTMEKAHGS